MSDPNSWITPHLEKIFKEYDPDDQVVKAASYSLFAGGKRMRPALMRASAKMLSIDPEEIAPYACALEMIHTYSLIHDDLPCMDNDDYRRGRATCHKVFGEGIAVLAGDMLLNSAHEVLLKQAFISENHARASYNISNNSGIMGMIGGQSIDLESEGKHITIDRLYELQKKKTGALILASITTPYYLSSYDVKILDLLKDFAGHLGLAFQIKDDILDVEADASVIGKSTGKDARDDKSTFVTMLGIEGAREKLREEEDGCYRVLSDLSSMNMDIIDLRELTDFNLKREY